MRRCEDEKMFYRPPLLEEPCAQTLSGKKVILPQGYGHLINRNGDFTTQNGAMTRLLATRMCM
jgi:hypothetical protein